MADENISDADKAAAAEMEKMMAAGGDQAAAPAVEGGEEGEAPPRVLNQDEIDLLLGFDAKEDADKSSGIFAIRGSTGQLDPSERRVGLGARH